MPRATGQLRGGTPTSVAGRGDAGLLHLRLGLGLSAPVPSLAGPNDSKGR